MEDGGKRAVERFWEEFVNEGIFDAVDSVLDPDYKLYDLAVARELDRDGLMATIQEVRNEIPAAHVIVEELLAAEGDRVVTRFTFRAPEPSETETPASDDNWLEFSGISISTVSNGLIRESWMLWEELRATEELRPSQKRWKWPPWR